MREVCSDSSLFNYSSYTPLISIDGSRELALHSLPFGVHIFHYSSVDIIYYESRGRVIELVSEDDLLCIAPLNVKSAESIGKESLDMEWLLTKTKDLLSIARVSMVGVPPLFKGP